MRAISSLIATVLMILITIAAVGVIVQAVMPMIKGNIEVANQCDSAKIEVSNEMGYTCYDPSVNIASISVSRGPGNVAIDGIQIKLIDSNGQSKIAEVIQGGNYSFIDSTQMPEINSEKAFNINASVLNITNIERVSVIPIIKIGKTSKICSSSGTTELPKCSSAATFQQTVPPQQPPPSPLWNPIVAYWTLNETATPIIDSSGKYNGTSNGPIAATGRLAGALEFDGSNDEIVVSLATSPSGSATMSAWVYGHSFSPAETNGRRIYESDNGIVFSVLSNNRLRFMRCTGGNPWCNNWVPLDSINSIPLNTWTHVAGSYNSTDGVWKVFINGNQDNTMTNQFTAGSAISNRGGPKIGAQPWTLSNCQWDGIIDEFAVWDRTLSNSEITQIYNSGAGRTYLN